MPKETFIGIATIAFEFKEPLDIEDVAKRIPDMLSTLIGEAAPGQDLADRFGVVGWFVKAIEVD